MSTTQIINGFESSGIVRIFEDKLSDGSKTYYVIINNVDGDNVRHQARLEVIDYKAGLAILKAIEENVA